MQFETISILSAPDNYSPSYVPLIYVVSVGAGLEENENFRYRCAIEVDGSIIAILKSVPHPEHGWGRFDISGVVQSGLELQKSWDNGIFPSRNSWESVTVRFGWEYVDTNGVFQLVDNNANQNRIYFNGAPGYNEWIDLKATAPWLITGTATNKYPLTVRRNIYTAPGTKQWLYFLNDNHNHIRYLEVRDTASNDAAELLLPSALQNNTDGKLVGFRMDKAYIESQTALVIGNSYTVRTLNDGFGPTSELITVHMLPCHRWELYSLYYMNRWGGVDSFSFNGKSERRENVQRETYGRTQPRINADGTIDFDGKYHTERQYHTSWETEYQLNTGWITEEQQETLRDGLASPLAWMETPTNSIVPVQMLSDQLEIRSRQDGLISSTIRVAYRQPNLRQGG